ncbi:MAG: GNAT family N-acetyltransferase [Turicibacter sp.]
MTNIKIQQEILSDYHQVHQVIKDAFENEEHSDHQEQHLVDRLRKSDEFIPELSLVAKLNDEVIGHILFTKINIVNDKDSSQSLALAPLAIVPAYKKQGIGTLLTTKGLEIAKSMGFKSVIVLGHETYYPRFGFKKASEYKIYPPFEVPDEAFMALELQPEALKNSHGTVVYSNAFFE